jgi:hypothetical protein
MSAIDWTVFDQYPENTVECQCGARFRSHTKAAIGDDGQFHICCRKPCPACGSTIAKRASSDPETFVIEEKDTAKIREWLESGQEPPYRPLYGDPPRKKT